MNKLSSIIAAVIIACSSIHVNAAPTDDAPPAQKQKDQVPDSTANGNYLEPQPDENGATQDTSTKHATSHTKKSKGSKPTNLEKSKKVTEQPENGGVNVNSN